MLCVFDGMFLAGFLFVIQYHQTWLKVYDEISHGQKRHYYMPFSQKGERSNFITDQGLSEIELKRFSD